MPPLLTGKRILILQGTLELGGAERYAFNLARFLKQKHQAEVSIWSFGDFITPTPLTHLLDKADIPWKSLNWTFPQGYRALLLCLIKWALVIRQFRPDIIFSFLQEPNIVAGTLWPFVGAAASVWSQQNDGQEHRGIFLEAFSAKRTPFFISNS